jgi:hypothetical protein
VKKKLILTAISATAILLVLWTVWGNMTAGVTRYTVESDRLPASFDRYKIAVVSDLHNTEFGKNNSRLAELIKKEKPDIIAITGDLIDYKKTDIGMAEIFIQKLVETAPCCYVTGNHEAWIGEQYQELEKKLLDAGVNIMRDRSEQLTKGSETIQLVGLDDPAFADSDSYIYGNVLETKLGNIKRTDEYCVLLSHRPEAFEAYASRNVDLVLSGHAHGGQFRLPFIGGLIAPNQGLFPQYDAGVYSENNTTMIVSRGLGNSIIPIRFNNRPEIVVVELICKK